MDGHIYTCLGVFTRSWDVHLRGVKTRPVRKTFTETILYYILIIGVGGGLPFCKQNMHFFTVGACRTFGKNLVEYFVLSNCAKRRALLYYILR